MPKGKFSNLFYVQHPGFMRSFLNGIYIFLPKSPSSLWIKSVKVFPIGARLIKPGFLGVIKNGRLRCNCVEFEGIGPLASSPKGRFPPLRRGVSLQRNQAVLIWFLEEPLFGVIRMVNVHLRAKYMLGDHSAQDKDPLEIMDAFCRTLVERVNDKVGPGLLASCNQKRPNSRRDFTCASGLKFEKKARRRVYVYRG
jgi:hypothetical protein